MPQIPKSKRTKAPGAPLINVPSSRADEILAESKVQTGQTLQQVAGVGMRVATDMKRRQDVLQKERASANALTASVQDYGELSKKYQEAMFKNDPDHEYMPEGEGQFGPGMTASQWFANEASKLRDTRTVGMTDDQKNIYLPRMLKAEETWGMDIAKRQYDHLARARLDSVSDMADMWATEARTQNIDLTFAKLRKDADGLSQVEHLILDAGITGERAEASREGIEEYLVTNAIIGMADRQPNEAVELLKNPGVARFFRSSGGKSATDKIDAIEKRIRDRQEYKLKLYEKDQERHGEKVLLDLEKRMLAVSAGEPGATPLMPDEAEALIAEHNLGTKDARAVRTMVDQQTKTMDAKKAAKIFESITNKILSSDRPLSLSEIVSSGVDPNNGDREKAIRLNNYIHKEDKTALKIVLKRMGDDHDDHDLFGKGEEGLVEYTKQVRGLTAFVEAGGDPEEYYQRIKKDYERSLWQRVTPRFISGGPEVELGETDRLRARRLEVQAERAGLMNFETYKARALELNKGKKGVDLSDEAILDRYEKDIAARGGR